MLARLRIGPKLLLAPGVVLVLLVLLCCGAYDAMVRQNGSLDSIVQNRATHMRAAAELIADAQTAHAQAYQVLTWMGGSFPGTRVDPLTRDLLGQHAAVARGFDALARATANDPDELRYVEQARAAWTRYVPAVRDVLEIARQDQSISANAMSKAERAFAIVAQRLTELARREQALSEQASLAADRDVHRVALWMPLVVVLSIVAALAITLAVRRALLAEIGAIGAAASGLAGGDLTVAPRDYAQDEIGQVARALDTGIRSMNGTMRTILDSARAIGSASREITIGRAALPPRAGVRDALDRTATSMQALSSALEGSADGARAAHRLAESAGAVAQQGNSLVHRVVATMEGARRSVLRLERIGASIEATLARADAVAHDDAPLGAPATLDARAAHDHAVAAAQVRALARRAVRAAQEARKLARSTAAAIEGGSAWAAQAGGSMADLASAVQEVGDIVGRIGATDAAQAHQLADVSQAITRIDGLTQQGARMVEDAALAARALQHQALGLARTVAAFRLDAAVRHESGALDETAPQGTQVVRPGGAGHPYLRLASSRPQGKARGDSVAG